MDPAGASLRMTAGAADNHSEPIRKSLYRGREAGGGGPAPAGAPRFRGGARRPRAHPRAGGCAGRRACAAPPSRSARCSSLEKRRSSAPSAVRPVDTVVRLTAPRRHDYPWKAAATNARRPPYRLHPEDDALPDLRLYVCLPHHARLPLSGAGAGSLCLRAQIAARRRLTANPGKTCPGPPTRGPGFLRSGRREDQRCGTGPARGAGRRSTGHHETAGRCATTGPCVVVAACGPWRCVPWPGPAAARDPTRTYGFA
jgi:hypothetical protein